MWNEIQKKLDHKKWSMQKLADKTGIPWSTLGNYKYDGIKPSFENIAKIANVLELDLNKLAKTINKKV